MNKPVHRPTLAAGYKATAFIRKQSQPSTMRTPQLPRRALKPRKPRIDRIYNDSILKIITTTIMVARGKRPILRVATMKIRKNRLAQVTAKMKIRTKSPSLEERKCPSRSQRRIKLNCLRRSPRSWRNQLGLKATSQLNISMKLQRKKKRNERQALNLTRF